MSNVITSPASTDPEAARLAALARYDILDTPPEPAFDRVARLVQMIFVVPFSAVSLIDAHRQWIKASCGVGVPELPLRDTFCNKTLRSDQPLVVPDLTEDPRFVDNPYVRGDMAVRFYAGTPIRTADGHNIGTVCAMDKKPRSFSENEVKILTELAQIVMDELELRQLASTDGLTGLSTRRAFKDQAARFVALARRHRSPLTAIAFDIDHFKSVNDTFGHATGDAVLRAVSEIALDTPRDSDLVGRLGGEEFAMILPGADIVSATAVAEKLRSAIAGRRFAGDRPPLVTASFGVAALDPDRDDLESLLIRADEALYEAKHGGRNQVVAHEAEGSATLASSERHRLLAAGRLLFDGGQSVLDCTVRAIWDGGAEIQIAEALDVPEAVVLEIPSQARSVKGAVRLRRPNGLELRFL